MWPVSYENRYQSAAPAARLLSPTASPATAVLCVILPALAKVTTAPGFLLSLLLCEVPVPERRTTQAVAMASRAFVSAARACAHAPAPRLGWTARRWAHPGAATAMVAPRVAACGTVKWASSRSVQVRTFAASASQIKELRSMTSAPISDCKKALNADGVDGDMDKAVDWLRKNGVATASKKAGRSAAEGVVCVLQSGEPPKSGVIVEVNS